MMNTSEYEYFFRIHFTEELIFFSENRKSRINFSFNKTNTCCFASDGRTNAQTQINLKWIYEFVAKHTYSDCFKKSRRPEYHFEPNLIELNWGEKKQDQRVSNSNLSFLLLMVISSDPESIYWPIGSIDIQRIISVWPVNTKDMTDGNGCKSLGLGNLGRRSSGSIVS